jgi:hypothetical protein
MIFVTLIKAKHTLRSIYIRVKRNKKKAKVELYEKITGKVPVLEYIQNLEPKHQAKVYREIDLLEKFGNELHYPHVDTIKGDKYKGLMELRIEFALNLFRILFFLPKNNKAILLHGITKKKQETPKKELDRMKEYLRRKI